VLVEQSSVSRRFLFTNSSRTDFLRRSASSGKLTCSVGDSPTGVEARSPLAWVVSVEETKRMKPTDKAIFGMVSESPGRNESGVS